MEKLKASNPSLYKKALEAEAAHEKQKKRLKRKEKIESRALKKARHLYEKKYKDKWVAVTDGAHEDWWMTLTGDVRVVFKGFVPVVEFRLCFTDGGSPLIWLPEKSFVVTRKYADD
jgi:hypothetical protein